MSTRFELKLPTLITTVIIGAVVATLVFSSTALSWGNNQSPITQDQRLVCLENGNVGIQVSYANQTETALQIHSLYAAHEGNE